MLVNFKNVGLTVGVLPLHWLLDTWFVDWVFKEFSFYLKMLFSYWSLMLLSFIWISIWLFCAYNSPILIYNIFTFLYNSIYFGDTGVWIVWIIFCGLITLCLVTIWFPITFLPKSTFIKLLSLSKPDFVGLMIRTMDYCWIVELHNIDFWGDTKICCDGGGWLVTNWWNDLLPDICFEHYNGWCTTCLPTGEPLLIEILL